MGKDEDTEITIIMGSAVIKATKRKLRQEMTKTNGKAGSLPKRED